MGKVLGEVEHVFFCSSSPHLSSSHIKRGAMEGIGLGTVEDELFYLCISNASLLHMLTAVRVLAPDRGAEGSPGSLTRGAQVQVYMLLTHRL